MGGSKQALLEELRDSSGLGDKNGGKCAPLDPCSASGQEEALGLTSCPKLQVLVGCQLTAFAIE